MRIAFWREVTNGYGRLHHATLAESLLPADFADYQLDQQVRRKLHDWADLMSCRLGAHGYDIAAEPE